MSNNDINYFLFNDISKNEFSKFIEKVSSFLNKENISKVKKFVSINTDLSNYKKIVILMLLGLEENNKDCSKIIDSIDEDFLIDMVKEKTVYNKLSRSIRQLILDRLSKSKWISDNYKGSF